MDGMISLAAISSVTSAKKPWIRAPALIAAMAVASPTVVEPLAPAPKGGPETDAAIASIRVQVSIAAMAGAPPTRCSEVAPDASVPMAGPEECAMKGSAYAPRNHVKMAAIVTPTRNQTFPITFANAPETSRAGIARSLAGSKSRKPAFRPRWTP